MEADPSEYLRVTAANTYFFVRFAAFFVTFLGVGFGLGFAGLKPLVKISKS